MPPRSASHRTIGAGFFEPPDNWMPGRLANSLLLVHDDARAVFLDAFGATPSGFSFRGVFLSREPIDEFQHGMRHHSRGDDIAVRYASAADTPVRVVPRGGGGTGTAWHRDYWCTPLPPAAGPVEFEVTLADGTSATGSIEGGLLLEAAERAVRLWPDREIEPPVIDPRTAPALPPPGPEPADPDAAREQIRAAYRQLLDHTDQSPDPMAAVQDGRALEGARQQARANHPGPTGTIRVALGEIVFIDEVRAAVQFQLNWLGAMTFGPQLGYAVLEDGRWKVARDTYSRVLGWAGVTVPPPPPQRPSS